MKCKDVNYVHVKVVQQVGLRNKMTLDLAAISCPVLPTLQQRRKVLRAVTHVHEEVTTPRKKLKNCSECPDIRWGSIQ
eukprot:7466270-Karenia_brevis.AAC.1